MATPTNAEQEILELINRSRFDPFGEVAHLVLGTSPLTGANADITSALNFFHVNVQALQQQLTGVSSVAPLAWSTNLGDAASLHSARMIQSDQQTHQAPGEADLGSRFIASGYTNFRSGGEDVFAFATSPLQAHAGFFIDWGNSPTGMQDPAGHRLNILSSNFTEVGIDATIESNSATSVGPLVVTEDFGARANYAPQIIGVVFRDADADNFYDAGEGLAGAKVSLSGASGTFVTTTWSSGGYQVAVPSGTYSITFSGVDLSTRTTTVTIGTQNIKIDDNDATLPHDPGRPDPALPSTVVYKFLYGVTPDAAKLASLSTFSSMQYDYYKSMGVARPEIGPFEALGVGFSDTTQFTSKFGSIDTANFVSGAYSSVFQRPASAVQADHFSSQIAYYEGLYKVAGVAADQAHSWSTGAILGQMLAVAVLDEPALFPNLVGAVGLASSFENFEL